MMIVGCSFLCALSFFLNSFLMVCCLVFAKRLLHGSLELGAV